MRRNKIEPEVRNAISLKKEYDMFMRYARRPGAAKIESDYYHNIAQRVSGQINWRLLEPKKKERINEV